jgi:fumarate hydratase class II
MSGKVIITTPFPTSEQVAAYYKIPAKRVAELRQMMDDIRAAEAKKDSRKIGRTNGSRKVAARRKTASSKR